MPTWNDFSDLTIPQFLSVCRQVTSGLSPPFNEQDVLTLKKADKAIQDESWSTLHTKRGGSCALYEMEIWKRARRACGGSTKKREM